MENITGRTAFVTGGAQGIGLGIARALAGAGAHVAIADLDEAALAAAEHELKALTTVECFALDVRDRAAYDQVADDVEKRLGPVTILCNNAGVAGAFTLAQMSYELWDLVLGVNVGGVVNGYQTFLPRMMARGAPAHVVNTAAGSGLASGGGVVGYMYPTSKYAVVGLSEATRIHLRQAGHPIGVTVLCPGPVPTSILETTYAALPDSAKPASESEAADRRQATDTINAYLGLGVHPDAVGTMVLDAIVRDRPYVHTDRTMWDAIWQRTKEVLDAMPANGGPSTSSLPRAELHRG
jgi:NAD(P)-dependent dehydrogenase (short-subunit alcohol dehydrogenase family)